MILSQNFLHESLQKLILRLVAGLLSGNPVWLATTTFHRPQIYLLSYYIDFRQLRFGLQMKVNAGGCTHRDKLDVVSKYNFLPSLHINSCMHMRACIARGLSGTPVHVDIYSGGRD